MIVSDADDFHNPFTTTIDIHSFHFLHLHRSATGRCMERLHIYNTYNTYFIYFECSWRLGDNLRRVLADFCCLVWKEGPSMFIQGIDRHLQYWVAWYTKKENSHGKSLSLSPWVHMVHTLAHTHTRVYIYTHSHIMRTISNNKDSN